MQRVGPLLGDGAMKCRQFADGLAAIVAALALARDGVLYAFDLPETLLQMAWVAFRRPVREGGERLHAQIHTHHWADVDGRRLFLLHLDAHVPMSRLL